MVKKENTDLSLMLNVVRQYYEAGLSQDDIAREQFISKASVSRLIKRAKQLGYVKIQVVDPSQPNTALEERFQRLFGLAHASIMTVTTPDNDLRMKVVCEVAADHIGQMILPDDVIAISWGRTMDQLALYCSPLAQHIRNLRIVMMNGSIGSSLLTTKASHTIEQLSSLWNAQGHLLPVPLYVDTHETANLLMGDSHIKPIIDLARTATIAIFSLGNISRESVLRKRNLLSATEYDRLVNRQAVGDIVGRFISISGHPVDNAMEGRTMALTLDELGRIPRRAAVSIGRNKANVILGALRRGLITHLYTDETTALEILKASGNPLV